MKKAALVAMALLILGAGVFLAVRSWRMRTFSERVFPEDTIVYAQVADLRQAGHEWSESQLGKAIAESPRKEVYRRLGERLAQSVESLIGADPRPVMRQFTRDAAIAILPLPSGRRGLGFAAYASDPSELRQYVEQKVDPGWLRRDPSLRRTSASYGEVAYYKYSSTKFPQSFQPCYAIVEHHLLFSNNEEAMKRLLDVRSKKSPSLRANKHLADAKARMDYRRGLLAFFNPQSARASLEGALPAQAKLIWPEVVKTTGLGGLEYIAWSMQVRDGMFEGRGFAGVTEKRSGFLKVLMERAPRKMEGIASVPDTAQFFSAVTLPDFSRLNQEGGANWTRIWLFVQAISGIDVRHELLETLGEEATFFSGSMDAEQASGPPVPKTGSIVLLRDPGRFGKTLDRLASLAASHGMDRSRETYGDAALSTFQFRYGSVGLAPSFCIQQSRFLFATDPALLKSAIDTSKNGHSLAATGECRAATAGFPAEVNALSCTRVPALLQSYASMLRSESSAGKTWIHEYGMDEEMTYLAGKLSSAASFARVEKDGVAFSSRSPVPAGLLALPPLAARLPELLSFADQP